MVSNAITKVSEEEYLALHHAAAFRHELLDGEIVAMSGVSMRHARLGANVFGQLYTALEESGCEAFTPDFRVRVSSRMYAYPDVTVGGTAACRWMPRYSAQF
jgi:Uma2 family endonuclease